MQNFSFSSSSVSWGRDSAGQAKRSGAPTPHLSSLLGHRFQGRDTLRTASKTKELLSGNAVHEKRRLSEVLPKELNLFKTECEEVHA